MKRPPPNRSAHFAQRFYAGRLLHHWFPRYGLALLSVAVAALVRHTLERTFGFNFLFSAFYPAVMLVAVLAGTGPGLLATLLSAVCADYFFIPPRGQFAISNIADAFAIAAFFVTGTSISLLMWVVDNTRARGEEAVRTSEERFRVALKNAPAVVFNQDRQLRYTWINSPVLAWADQGYLGRTDAEIVGGEEGARLMAIKKTVLDSGIGSRTETIVSFQGEPHYFDLTVEPLHNSDGKVVGVTCVAVDITPVKQGERERERLIGELQEALAQVKVLRGLLPICASCKKIRDEHGHWDHIESYIQARSEASFSHGICPECARRLYPEFDLYPKADKH